MSCIARNLAIKLYVVRHDPGMGFTASKQTEFTIYEVESGNKGADHFHSYQAVD